MKIVLIGTGNVASHLSPVLVKAGHKIIQVYGRSKKNADVLARKLRCPSTNKIGELKTDADFFIVLLRDEAIAPFLKSLKFIPSFIVHSSGSTSLDVFPKNFKNAGVLYPVQTFSKERSEGPQVIPFCIEGKNSQSLRVIRKLASSISSFVVEMNSREREYVHLAAVFANNFSNHLYVLAEKMLSKKKLSFEILRPLILETAQKIQTGVPSDMQTGPAMRGDRAVIDEHIKLLKGLPELKKIYRLLSKSIEKEFSRR